MSIKCSDCQNKFLPKYPSWLRLVHVFEFLREQEVISQALYDSSMNDVMSVKYAVDIMDEQRERLEKEEQAKYAARRKSVVKSRKK